MAQSLTSSQRRRLQNERAEWQRRYDTMSKRIAALDTDIGRALDSEHKLILQQRRDELAAERVSYAAHIDQIDAQLAGQGQPGPAPPASEALPTPDTVGSPAPPTVGHEADSGLPADDITIGLLSDEAQQGRLTLFIGAALPSRMTGLPSSQDLARQLADRYQLSVAADATLPTVAQQAGRRGDVLRYLKGQLDTTGLTPQPFDLLLARLEPIRLIVTTRYDDLIEKAFLSVPRPLDVLVTDMQAMLRTPGRTALLKLYGDLRQPASVTLIEDDIWDLDSQKKQLMDIVRQALSSTTALLVGYDLNSPDFQTLWRESTRRAGANVLRAYAVRETPFTEAERDAWLRRDVELLHASSLAVLQALADRLSLEGSGEPAQRASGQADISPSPVPPVPRPDAATGIVLPGKTGKPRTSLPVELPVRHYRNFDLEITQDGNQIRVRVQDSPEGEAEAVVPAFAEPPVLDPRTGLQGLDEAIGQRLLSGAVAERWAANKATAERDRVGLRLRLNLRGTALHGIPWEAASRHGQRLALRPQTPLVRYVRAGRAPDKLTVAGPLRMLILLSASQEIGLEPLDTKAERNQLEEALAPLVDADKLQVHWLQGPITRRELLDTLRRVQPHLLHVFGHGAFDEASGQGTLVLSRRASSGKMRADYLGSAELAIALDGSKVRFALLNACQTGRAAGGVAEALVQAVLPAALGMQADVPDAIAAAFAGAFYRALADGWPVDAAVADARRLVALEHGLDRPWWALPVLYMRSEDGVLFARPAAQSGFR